MIGLGSIFGFLQLVLYKKCVGGGLKLKDTGSY